MNIQTILRVAALAWITTAGFSEETRTWTSLATGRPFAGVFVSATETSVSIRRAADHVVFEVKKADLVPEDLDWITRHIQEAPPAGAVDDLSELISRIPGEQNTPAVAVLVIERGAIRGMGVAGVRKAGDLAKVGMDDKWHLGSCTKSMTATLAATFVEEGAINWETTVGEVLGKKMKILKDYEPVTLGLLLANRGGIPGSVPDTVFAGVETGTAVRDLSAREILKQRAGYAEAVLNVPPASPPGTRFQYSNSGYVVAGVMLEVLTGKPWEELIEERIFNPLGMTNSGFGNAARSDKQNPSQPWPHQDDGSPVPPGSGDDNSWVLGPAGTVHGSLKDIARYLTMHSTLEAGPVLKKRATFDFLHTAVPGNNDYARGWIVATTPWSQGPAISHDGSNTMNHCSVWIAPKRRAAVAAFTNSGRNGNETCRAAIQIVTEAFFQGPP